MVDVPADAAEGLARRRLRGAVAARLPDPRLPNGRQLRRAAAGAIAEARRPVLYAGGGVVHAEAAAELATLARRFDCR